MFKKLLSERTKELINIMDNENMKSIELIVDRLKENEALKKEQKLFILMIRSYSPIENVGWVSMENIIKATGMSSFNQRFQTWRKNGMIIKNRNKDKLSEYKLVTEPYDVIINIEMRNKPQIAMGI